MSKIHCVYLAGEDLNFSSANSRSKSIVKQNLHQNVDYLLFVGTEDQFLKREIEEFRQKNLVVHFATAIVNMNYSLEHNPRLAYLLLRNNNTLKQLLGVNE